MTVEAFWNSFLKETGRDNDTTYIDCFHFELTEQLANELLHLVLIGQKQATASSLWGYEIEGDKIPEVGDLYIITNWDGEPKCVIETTNVTILPYKDVTYDICKREGEDDSLESWRWGHEAFFRSEGEELGYNFTEEMPVIFEDFHVIYKLD